jgi:hypothetical protein
MTLYRSHATNFFKTLRNNHNRTYKNSPKPKISYIICGEYGDKFKRPHYHAIIFGASRTDILNSWKHGLPYFGAPGLEATVNYTLKYSLKSRFYKYHETPFYERPFINVSKGIGLDLIVDPFTGEQKLTTLPELVTVNGYTTQLPRYYAQKLNMNIDTTKFKDEQIELQRKWEQELKLSNTTRYAYVKNYHNDRYNKQSNQNFNNEIHTNLDSSLILPYSPQKK